MLWLNNSVPQWTVNTLTELFPLTYTGMKQATHFGAENQSDPWKVGQCSVLAYAEAEKGD